MPSSQPRASLRNRALAGGLSLCGKMNVHIQGEGDATGWRADALSQMKKGPAEAEPNHVTLPQHCGKRVWVFSGTTPCAGIGSTKKGPRLFALEKTNDG